MSPAALPRLIGATLVVVLGFAGSAFAVPATTTTVTVTPQIVFSDEPVTVTVDVEADDGTVPDGVVQLKQNGTQVTSEIARRGYETAMPVLAVGSRSACAVDKDTGAVCWGSGARGQLGRGSLTGGQTPAAMTGFASGVRSVAAGDGFNCLLTLAGAVFCTGANDVGQLGDGTTIDRTSPVQVAGLPSGVTALASRGNLTCAIKDETNVLCWGAGDATPVDIGRPPTKLRAITVGWKICMLTADGEVWCLDPAKTAAGTRAEPLKVAGLPSGVTSVSAGASHVCALHRGTDANGGLWCWGSNADGQFGDGSTSSTPVTTPTKITDAALDAGHALATVGGGTANCLIDEYAEVRCTGRFGASPTGDTNGSTYRRIAGLTFSASSGNADAKGVAVGAASACGTTGDTGSVLCWGDAADGKLGSLSSLVARRRAGLVFITTTLPTGTTTFNGGYVNFTGVNLYGVSSATKQVTVRPRASIALASSKPTAPYGEDVTLTAQVTANDGSTPQGSVTFYRDGAWVQAVALDAQGKATVVAKSRDVGGYDWYAYFNGNGTWSTATSPTLRQSWSRASTTTAVAASVTPPVFGQPVKFTATVAGGAATAKGNVVFAVDGVDQATVALVGGVASWTTSKMVSGDHGVTAAYGGNGNFQASSGTLKVSAETETVTTVTYDATPVPYGTKVPMTVSVVGKDGRKPTAGHVLIVAPTNLSPSYGSGFLGADGTATVKANAYEVGPWDFVGEFVGLGEFRGSVSAKKTLKVLPGRVTISAPKPALPVQQYFGKPLAFDVTIKSTDVPGWSFGSDLLWLELDGKRSVSAPVDADTGIARFALPTGLPFGTHAVTVAFDGDTHGYMAAARTDPVTSAADFRTGAETRVPIGTVGAQNEPAIAAGINGGAMVVWRSAGSDPTVVALKARMLDADGKPLGAADLTVRDAAKGVDNPAVTALSNGDYAVVWQEPTSNGIAAVFMRRFAPNGTPRADAVQVSPVSGRTPRIEPSVAAGNGTFAIVWATVAGPSKTHVYGAIFDNAGASKMAPRLLPTNPTLPAVGIRPAVAAAGGGNGYVVAWPECGTANGRSCDPRMLLFDTTGPKGSPVTIASEGLKVAPEIVLQSLPDGGVAAAWSKAITPQVSATVIRWRRFDKALKPVTDPTVVDGGVSAGQTQPSMTLVAGGRPAIAWTESDGTQSGLWVQLVGADNARVEAPGQVDTFTAGVQSDVALAALKANGAPKKVWVAVWTSAGQDGSGDGVYMQTFTAP